MAVHFDHPTFDTPDLADLKPVHQDSWYTGQDAEFSGDAAWLNPDPEKVKTNFASNIGRVVYRDPIRFTPTKSFRTCFSFKIITTAGYGLCGSGFAFFIQDSEKAPAHSTGRYLGLVDPPHATGGSGLAMRFFAVEFDTHQSDNLHDISASHIGIDVNSLISVSYADSSPGSALFPELFLYHNYSFTVWVDYNGSSNLIQVWMTKSGRARAPVRPSSPILEQLYNLSSVFGDRPVYVGFSGSNNATEDSMQGAVLWSWSFSDEDTSQHGKTNTLLVHVIAPIIAAVCALIMLLVLTSFLLSLRRWHHRHRGSSIRPDKPGPIQRQYTLRELKKATNNFSNKNEVGRGAFSIVYRGIQPDGSIMAVKKLKQGVRKEDEFASAMRIISTCRHKNILELQGWYYGKREAMLVYKFMQNSSLDEYLYGSKGSNHVLSSEVRLRILEEVSLALRYMHTDLDECVLHRDVKPANVLLADGFKAILGDFGLACLVDHNGEVLTTTPVGTLGYIAPEVLMEGRATEKSDVYSFGVLVFEVAYGRRVIISESHLCATSENSLNLLQWVWKLKDNSQDIVEALDPRMSMGRGLMPADHAEKWRNLLHIAFLCCNLSPEERPTMTEVSQALQGGKQELLLKSLPTRPPLLQVGFGNLMPVSNSNSNVYFS